MAVRKPLSSIQHWARNPFLITIGFGLLLFFTHNIRETWFPNPPPPSPPASEDISRALVIPKTRWQNVLWAYRLKRHWTPYVYSVDKEQGFDLRLPANRGREAMAYLTFIVDNYDRLPEIVAFIHGADYQWHNDLPGLRTSSVLEQLRISAVRKHGYVNLRCKLDPGCPTSVNPFSPSDEDIRLNDVRAYFAEVYMHLFNVTLNKVPEHIGGVCCAQFAVSRDQIRKRPRSDYIRMREWALTTKLDSYGVGWVFEMIWHIIFGKDDIFCPVYKQCMCDVYGKC